MNQYLKNLTKCEFVITNDCTGKCKHCSEGDHGICGERIAPHIAADTVRKVASAYNIETVMTFGGEPLLYVDSVSAILSAAHEMKVPKRQIITNGFFSKDINHIRETAKRLSECFANDILLSVDAFHQETIPLETVKIFAEAVKSYGLPIRLQPAWLVSPEHDNPYNRITRELLDSFKVMEIYENEGNIIFPEGNAKIYLNEYFPSVSPENPYVEDPFNVRCISFDPKGNVLDGNIFDNDILDILQKYSPKQ